MPLVLDSVGDRSDVIAMVFAAAHGAPFRAVTVSYGDRTVEENAVDLLDALEGVGLAHIPVHLGARVPITRSHSSASSSRLVPRLGAQSDVAKARIDAIQARITVGRAAGELASVEIIRLAWEEPQELVLIARDPLTNLALALLLEPQLPRALGTVMIVVEGTNDTHQFADPTGTEGADPVAAQIVADAGLDIVLIPTHVAAHARTSELMVKLEASSDRRAEFLTANIWDVSAGPSSVPKGALPPLGGAIATALTLDPTLAEYRPVRRSTEPTGLSQDRHPSIDSSIAGLPGESRFHLVTEIDEERFHRQLLRAAGA